MSEPIGAVHLAWRHSKERRWTKVTAVVLAYLLLSMAGRLSVAVFGLTFDLTEVTGIEYPVTVANWNYSRLANTPSYLNLSTHGFPDTEEFRIMVGEFSSTQYRLGSIAD